jgi:hypothetical protein
VLCCKGVFDLFHGESKVGRHVSCVLDGQECSSGMGSASHYVEAAQESRLSAQVSGCWKGMG